MVVSHRETTISSNIRAIIEQLNLNPVERRRLIDRKRETARIRPVSSPAKITIGVYGCRDRDIDVKPQIEIYKEKNEKKPKIEIFKEKSSNEFQTEKHEISIEKPKVEIVGEKPKKIVEIGKPKIEFVKEKFEAKIDDKSKVEIIQTNAEETSNSGKVEIYLNLKDKSEEQSKVELFVNLKERTVGERCDKIGAHDGEIVTPVTSPSGKVTIGVWGQSKSELRIERAGSFGRVIRKPGIDDERKCVVVSRTRKAELRQRVPPEQKEIAETTEVTRTQQDVVERIAPVPKEDLPELESASLSHTAAHHRISVRPKNRRPPRRTVTTSSLSTITTISESSDALDSLEATVNSAGGSPTEPKAPTVLRKSSSRLSRNSDIFEELESKLPKKPASVASLSPDSLDSSAARTILDHTEPEESREIKPVTRKLSNRISKGSDVFEELESRLPRRRSSNRQSKSPDSLENSFSKSSEGFDKFMEHEEVKPAIRRLQSSMSKSTEGFDKISEEVKPMPRRLTNAISKSTEGFDKLVECDEPRPVTRRLLHPISKSTDVVSKSSDSLEVLEALISDDSMERRRSSFEIRPRRGLKAMSMSSENFEALEQVQELQKRNSASDVNLSRGKRHCKVMSKSTENFEPMETNCVQEELNVSSELEKPTWRSTKRVSSESSDNLEGDDKSERKIRRPPKRIPSSSIVDIFPKENQMEEERRPVPMRKPTRLQKSSESSELGSTDTLDSERRNKSSDSTETLDSLEKDGEQDNRDEEMLDAGVEKRDKNDSWTKPESEPANADGNEEPKTPEKNYWRQTSESKENIDIHQLLAITIVSRMSDNGNNQRNNSVQFPKKKLASPPTSPVVKPEDNKLLFNNLLATKNDEDLQNMLNGNISEVSTDTKSFKEKLIMFEKLGK